MSTKQSEGDEVVKFLADVMFWVRSGITLAHRAREALGNEWKGMLPRLISSYVADTIDENMQLRKEIEVLKQISMEKNMEIGRLQKLCIQMRLTLSRLTDVPVANIDDILLKKQNVGTPE